MENKFAYLFTGGHRVHEAFANTFTKDHFKSSFNIPKNYEYYFCEGAFFRPIMLRILGRIKKNSKIIALFSDPRLYYFDNHILYDQKNDKIKKYPKWRWKLFKLLLNKLDGAICVGKYQTELLKKYYSGPIKTVYPYIDDKSYKTLVKNKPKLNSKNILFASTWGDQYCKGLDFTLKVFNSLKKQDKNIKLTILGKIKPKKSWLKKNLSFEGYKKREVYLDYYKNNSLLIHFGRGESFGINILESMLAGVPVIVSENTGAKEVVKDLDTKHVTKMDDETYKLIIKYLNMNIKQKEKLSNKARLLAKKFTKEKQIKIFKERFNELLLEIK